MKKVEKIPESVRFDVSLDHSTDIQTLQRAVDILRDSMNTLTDAFNELVDDVERLG